VCVVVCVAVCVAVCVPLCVAECVAVCVSVKSKTIKDPMKRFHSIGQRVRVVV